MKDFFDKKQLAILLVMLAGAAAIGGWQYYPVHLQKAALRQTLTGQEAKMEEIRIHCEKLPMLHRLVKELESVRTDYDRQLPSDQQFARLWQEIATLMNENNLKEQMVRPGTVECGQIMCRIPLQIECRGSFEEIFSFFRQLEHFERLIRMDEIRIKNDSQTYGQVKLSAQASVYYQPSASKDKNVGP